MELPTEEQMKDIIACANFMQKAKMIYWNNHGKSLVVSEKDLDEILMIAWDALKK